MLNLTLQKRQLCDIQGRLFELALKTGYDCPAFIKSFMRSRTAAALDDVYDRLQWAGEEYILEELDDEVGGLRNSGIRYSKVYIATGIIIQVKAAERFIKLQMKKGINRKIIWCFVYYVFYRDCRWQVL